MKRRLVIITVVATSKMPEEEIAISTRLLLEDGVGIQVKQVSVQVPTETGKVIRWPKQRPKSSQ